MIAPERRLGRLQEVEDGIVVGRDHRHVARDLEPAGADRRDRAEDLVEVRHEDRGRAGSPASRSSAAAAPPASSSEPAPDPGLDAGRLGRRQEPGDAALDDVARIDRPGHVPDHPMAERGEMLDRQLRHGLLGQPDVAAAAGHAAAGEDARRPARHHAPRQRAVGARARHDEPVDAGLGDEPLVGLLRRRVARVLGHQHDELPLPGAAHDGAHHLAPERVAERRHEHADGAGRLGLEAARHRVRLVAEARRDGDHAVARLRIDRPVGRARERARCGRRVHAGLARDVVQADGPTNLGGTGSTDARHEPRGAFLMRCWWEGQSSGAAGPPTLRSYRAAEALTRVLSRAMRRPRRSFRRRPMRAHRPSASKTWRRRGSNVIRTASSASK